MMDDQPSFHKPWITAIAPGQPEHDGEIGVMAVECGNPDCSHGQCRDVSLLLFGRRQSLDARFSPEMAIELGERLMKAGAIQLSETSTKQ